MTDSDLLYKQARDSHYIERDLENAIVLYRQVIEENAKAETTRKAALQLEKIYVGIIGRERDPQSAAESQRELEKIRKLLRRIGPSETKIDFNRDVGRRVDYQNDVRFGGLRIMSGLLKVFAVLSGAGGVLVSNDFFDRNEPVLGMGILLGTGLSVLVWWSLAEIINVVLAIEENTRKAAASASALDFEESP